MSDANDFSFEDQVDPQKVEKLIESIPSFEYGVVKECSICTEPL